MPTKTFAPTDNSEAAIRARRFGTTAPTQTAPTGIVTSDEAESRVKEINETIGKINTGVSSLQGKSEEGGESSTSPFAGLFERINLLQENLNTAKENERIAKESLENQDLAAKLGSQISSEEAGDSAKSDLSAGADAVSSAAGGGEVDTSGIEDPVIRALTDKSVANVSILNQQMQSLGQYREQFNEYTQSDIDSIARTAERSITRQLEENERVKRAMEFAGVVGGMAQFSPITEQTVINEVVQEGLDKIEIINEKKNTAIREARKAEADFNIDLFEQQANLAKEYNDEIESTISAMNAQVRQVEKDEREKMEFRQTQEERSSAILAGELVNATPEQIAQAAAANGIDFALLTKAVGDAKVEQADRKFTEESNLLTLEQKKASLAQTRNATRLANEKAARETGGEDDFDATENALLRQAGLGEASFDEKVSFLNKTKAKQDEAITAHQEEEEEKEGQSINDVISGVVGSSSFFKKGEPADNIKAAASAFGINPEGIKNEKEARNFLKTVVQNLKTTYPDITDAEVKEYLRDIPEDATAEEITAYLQFAREGI